MITLIAKDKDFGENARVSYSLVSENEKKPLFKIDETTGINCSFIMMNICREHYGYITSFFSFTELKCSCYVDDL